MKKNLKTKILAILLTTVMILSTVPMNVFAEESVESFTLMSETQAEVSVTIKMNAISKTFTLVNAQGEEVSLDDMQTSGTNYTLNLKPGNYTLTGYATDGTTVNGTIEFVVTEEESQTFTFQTVTAYATNSGWSYGTDYTLDITVSTTSGGVRNITLGDSITAGRKTFLIGYGESYRADFVPESGRISEGYTTTSYSGTVTFNTTLGKAVQTIAGAQITVPSAEYQLEVGTLTNYFVYNKVEPMEEGVQNPSGSVTYNYQLVNGTSYYYRVTKAGDDAVTYTNWMTAVQGTEITVKPEDMGIGDISKNKSTVVHDFSQNAYDVADIYLNINPQNYLKLSGTGDTFQIVNLRNWLPIEGISNAKAMEPDFHYSVYNLNAEGKITVGNGSVVEVSDNGKITATGIGTAVVLVTYDALINTGGMGGDFFSAIWPENTGVFVVSVGQGDSGIDTGMTIHEGKNASSVKISADELDAELDVLYYLKGTQGAEYSFTPTAGSNVSVLRPVVSETSLTYRDGFTTQGVSWDGNTVTVSGLCEGRNIVKIEKGGKAEYQVITAKEVSYTIENATNPGEQIQPGDTVNIVFERVYIPANKLSGIYNMSGTIQYVGENGITYKGAANQYLFASTKGAQTVTVKVPEDWDTSETFLLQDGCIYESGYGSPYGDHRNVTYEIGKNPNFTASMRNGYMGSLPNISFEVHEKEYYQITLKTTPEDAQLIVKDVAGNTVLPMDGAEGYQYRLSYGTYTYETSAAGYEHKTGTFQVTSSTKRQETIQIPYRYLGDASWDGKTLEEPQQDNNGIYRIEKGSELAWIAKQVSEGNTELNVCLVSDISLGNYEWTPIGNSANPYTGTFDGNGKTVEGIQIQGTSIYQGFFGKTKNAVIENLTAKGEIQYTGTATSAYCGGLTGYIQGTEITDCVNEISVTNPKNYTGGIASYATENSIVTDCTNKEAIKGTQYTAGIIGKGDSVNIEGSVNEGVIAGTNYTAGIVGNITNSKTGSISQLKDCINGGTVTGKGSYVGGIVAYFSVTNAQGGVISCTNKASITNEQTTGTPYTGGIVGWGNYYVKENSNFGIVTGAALTGKTDGIAGYSKTESYVTDNCDYTGIADGKTITVSIEKFVLGQGYVTEPMQITVPKDATLAEALVYAYKKAGIQTGNTGSVEEGYYLNSVTDKSRGELAIPQQIQAILEENGVTIETDSTPDTLDEMDYGFMSGWMISVNNQFPDVGASDYVVTDGDVVRIQYTLTYGRDLDSTLDWATPAFEKLADKTELTAAVACIHEELLRDGYYLETHQLKSSYQSAMEILTRIDSTQTEVNAAYKALTGKESAITDLDKPKEPQEKPSGNKTGTEEILNHYEETKQFLQSLGTPQYGEVGGEWLVIGMARAELPVPEGYYNAYIQSVEKELQEKNGVLSSRKYTEYSRVVLALTALKQDVANVAGYNLLEPLADFNAVCKQGINGPIFALLAFDSGNYEIPVKTTGEVQTSRENLIAYILDKEIGVGKIRVSAASMTQDEDDKLGGGVCAVYANALMQGGWALSGNTADADVTAMAIQALAPYYRSNVEVTDAVDRALVVLSNLQNSDGSFSSYGVANAESTSQVIVALTSLGINPAEDNRFIKNGNTVIDGLMQFAVDGGGFMHVYGGQRDGMATEQAFYALTAYNRLLNGKSPLYHMDDTKEIIDLRVEPTEQTVDNIQSTVAAKNISSESSLLSNESSLLQTGQKENNLELPVLEEKANYDIIKNTEKEKTSQKIENDEEAQDWLKAIPMIAGVMAVGGVGIMVATRKKKAVK